ncbi:OLC1v1031315C1 [Oldenlandia corymbosa var. corymbosa]|uniref:OLC1v1031315C1 n=1 Tax=Oldenlandia corymbosa var. corymbosa TaxID=529605 RepID=A0AAV1CJ61_OLDCO|nr:OLC1v1031315C1 [Oldenlandia corymbosa var. corymbosa]
MAADPNIDPYGYMGIAPNEDGSITRLAEKPSTPASSDPGSGNPFHLSKDIPINPSKHTWARIFLPRQAFDSSPLQKLPLFIYFYGGGFVVCRVNSSVFDGLYTTIAAGTPAVVISVGYRRAPEHRLPAAYDDSEEALHWVKSCKDEWLIKYADFSKCFLMGTSAGGNIVYHVGLRAAEYADSFLPLQIKGLILHQPFFGGTKRSGSELRLANDKVLPLCVSDLMWKWSLPVGVDRDHEYSNPVLSLKSGRFDGIKALGWKVLITGCDGDPLVDREMELAKKLEEHGVPVTGKFDEGGYHGCDSHDPSRAAVLTKNLKEFVESAINSSKL